MPNPTQKEASKPVQMGASAPSSSQSAQYTRDLIDSLRKMAKGQKQEMLAILLEAASMEAKRIAGRNH